LGRILRSPVVFDRFQPLNLARPPINPVAIDYRIRFGVSAAFGVVIFTEDKLKISVACLFGAVGNTIQGDSMRINAVVLKSALSKARAASSSSKWEWGPAWTTTASTRTTAIAAAATIREMGFIDLTKHCAQTSARVELRFLRGDFFVSPLGAHVVAESANAGLGDHKFAAGEL
jgi:hypothetical protein